MEKEIRTTYSRANKEMKEKLKSFLEKYEAENKELQSQLKSGDITEEQYQEWLQSKAYARKGQEEMIEVLTNDMYDTNAIAAQMVRKSIPETYVLNANYAAFQIDKTVGFMTSFSLYNADTVARLIRDKPALLPVVLPKVTVKKKKDKTWNRRKIRNEITQGILQGESVQTMAKRLEKVVGMNKGAAIRNARTATTSAQNGGRMDTIQRAVGMGINAKKSWGATMDTITRSAHRLLDGQIQPQNKPFKSELGDIMYPGDPGANPANVYNCRCRLVAVVKGSDYDPKDLSKRFTRLPEGTTYEEWQKAKSRKKGADDDV